MTNREDYSNDQWTRSNYNGSEVKDVNNELVVTVVVDDDISMTNSEERLAVDIDALSDPPIRSALIISKCNVNISWLIWVVNTNRIWTCY